MSDEQKIRERLAGKYGRVTVGAVSPVQQNSGSLFADKSEPVDTAGAVSATQSLFADKSEVVIEAGPSVKAQMTDFGKHAAKGAVQGAGTGMAIAVGAKAGAMAGAPFTPIFPAAPLVGGVIGGVAGAIGGQYLPQDPFGIGEAETPAGVGGNIFGESVGGAIVPLAVAKAGVQTGLVGVDRILDYARGNPVKFAAGEISSALSAAEFGGMAKSHGGSEQEVAAASIVGGVINPMHWFTLAGKGVVRTLAPLTAAVPFFGAETRTLNKAARLYQKAAIDNGGDIVQLAKELKKQGLINDAATSAQKTGSPGLAAIEDELMKISASFGEKSRQSAEESMHSAKTVIAAMRGTGDPQLLKMAAKAQEQYIASLISAKLAATESMAADIAKSINVSMPLGREQVGIASKALIKESTRTLRKVEEGLYEVVPREVQSGTNNAADAYREVRGYLNKGESLGGQIDEFFENIIGKKGGDAVIIGKNGLSITTAKGSPSETVTTGDLLRQRSILLSKARDAASANRPDLARIYGDLEQAILKDLDAALPGDETYKTARSFTFQFHEIYTRTYAGDLLAKNPKGAFKILPEVAIEQAFGQGGVTGKVRMQMLRDAVEFLPKEGIGGKAAEENVTKMLTLQDEFLRESASQLVSPSTKRIDPDAAAIFMHDNREVLAQFPDVKTAIEAAMTSEQAAQGFAKFAGYAEKTVKTKAFAKLAGFDDPTDAIKASLSGKTPTKDFSSIVKFAKTKNAQDELLASVFDNAYRNAGTPTGAKGEISGVNLGELKAQLFDPITPNSPSVMGTLHKEGVITTEQIGTAKQVFDEVSKIEKALNGKSSQQIMEQIQRGTILETLVAKVLGSSAATFVAKHVAGAKGGSSLIAAGAGATAARQLWQKMPEKSVIALLTRASLDKKFAAMLLERPVTPEAARQLMFRAHSYAIVAFPDLFPDERAVAKDDTIDWKAAAQKQSRSQMEHRAR